MLDLGRFERVIAVGVSDSWSPAREHHSSGLEIHRALRCLPPRSDCSGALHKLARSFAFTISLARFFCTAVSTARVARPEYVTCHNPTLLPLGWCIAHLVGGKLSYSPHELEVSKTGLGPIERKLVQFFEWCFARHAKSIVTVCEPIAIHYRERYSVPTYVVRSIPSVCVGSPPAMASERMRELKSSSGSGLVFIYQGGLSRHRGVEYLLSAFQSEQVFHSIAFMGYGESERLIRAATKHCNRVGLLPALPLTQALGASVLADVGLFVIPGTVSQSYELCLPNKFFEYMRAGIPIIASDNLALLSRIIKAHRLGWVVKGEDLPNFLREFRPEMLTEIRPHVVSFAESNTWAVEREILLAAYP